MKHPVYMGGKVYEFEEFIEKFGLLAAAKDAIEDYVLNEACKQITTTKEKL